LSAHELRLRRMQEKIEALEDANVANKPWQLRGEVGAAGRPLNSLLEEHIDFEAAARPAPAITQDVTESIEDIIKQRILQ
ncbi:U3 small nucleolar ribonucleoprotein complex, subunit Mpp10, partial [Pavlovales sp. CCMP2436]